MSFTRMMPGALNTEGQSEAVFYDQEFTVSLADSNIETASTTDDLDDWMPVQLPDRTEIEVVDMEVGQQSNGDPIVVSLAIYYPTTHVNHSVDCEELSLTETNSDKINCTSIYSGEGSYVLGYSDTSDTGVETTENSNDLIYDWGSDVLPVYLETVPEGAFEDLGFAQGWNLAKIVQGEIILVEPLNSLDQLSQVVFDK